MHIKNSCFILLLFLQNLIDKKKSKNNVRKMLWKFHGISEKLTLKKGVIF